LLEAVAVAVVLMREVAVQEVIELHLVLLFLLVLQLLLLWVLAGQLKLMVVILYLVPLLPLAEVMVPLAAMAMLVVLEVVLTDTLTALIQEALGIRQAQAQVKDLTVATVFLTMFHTQIVAAVAVQARQVVMQHQLNLVMVVMDWHQALLEHP
jgi:hypothetical protein